MKRSLTVLAAVACAVGAAAGVGGAAPYAPPAVGSTVRPTADAYVSPRAPAARYGKKKTLLVGGKARARSYLRFTTPPLPQGGSQIAFLQLYVTKPGGRVTVKSVRSTTWNERKLSSRTAPRLGPKRVSFVPRKRGTITVNVTRALRSGALSIALTGGGKGAAFASREAGRRGPKVTVSTTATLLAAGDIAGCDTHGDEQTAALIAQTPGLIAALGDNVYENGTDAEYHNCYDPAWGPFKARTRPTAGNHEYHTPGAKGYYDYFGALAGPPFGYYSYDLGAWHIVVLNSNCFVAGCDTGTQQEAWLRADLASHPARCTLAYWHHPRFSSGFETDNPAYIAFWQDLYNAGADVVLVGHAHNYQRYAPQTPTGARDDARGVREFVVGTGGRSHHAVTPVIANEEVANDTTFGVLDLKLGETGYTWKFLPVAGSIFTDSGSASCH